MTDSLHSPPEPDRFTHESPIRAFTDWKVSGNYAIGKGFRPSLAHLTVYLDAMQTRENWSLLQILEAATGSPSFVFRRIAVADRFAETPYDHDPMAMPADWRAERDAQERADKAAGK